MNCLIGPAQDNFPHKKKVYDVQIKAQKVMVESTGYIMLWSKCKILNFQKPSTDSANIFKQGGTKAGKLVYPSSKAV